MNAADGVDWPTIITNAYANDTRPPLTTELANRVREALAEVLGTSSGAGAHELVDKLNGALDTFEIGLRAVVGPRILSLDDAKRVAVMMHRSEAGQPLRAFGGQ